MKKRLALMCMAGVVIVGLSACSGGQSDDGTAQTMETVSSTEAAQTGTADEKETDKEAAAEVERVSDREDYVGLQDLEIEKYITLADYKSMEVRVARPEVDDESVEQYINAELLVGMITDRAVQDGDVADIDFEGKRDGVAFEGGAGKGFQLVIGSGNFIPGFEDGLIGVMPGETVDLNLTFPENYNRSPELAGQDVVFTVTVNGIQSSAEYETVTPEDMKSMGLSYRTKEELWKAGKKDMEQYADETFEANARSAVLQKLVEESTVISIPEYLVEEEAQNYNLYMETLTAMYDMDLETFVSAVSGLTLEEYDSQVNEMCTDLVRQYLVIEAVARAEGIEITDKMIQEKADQEAGEYGYDSGEALIEQVGFTSYRITLVQDKVIERLMEIVSVEEEEAQEASES